MVILTLLIFLALVFSSNVATNSFRFISTLFHLQVEDVCLHLLVVFSHCTYSSLVLLLTRQSYFWFIQCKWSDKWVYFNTWNAFIFLIKSSKNTAFLSFSTPNFFNKNCQFIRYIFFPIKSWTKHFRAFNFIQWTFNIKNWVYTSLVLGSLD